MKKIEIFRIPDGWESANVQQGIYKFVKYIPNGIPMIECPWGWAARHLSGEKDLDPNKRYYYLTKQKDLYWRFVSGIVICEVKGEKDENR